MERSIAHYTRQAPAFDSEKIETFLSAVSLGGTFLEACEQADLSKNTVRTWINKGGNPQGKSRRACAANVHVEPYYTFVQRYLDAKSKGVRRNAPGAPHGRRPNEITEEQKILVLDAIRQGWSYQAACTKAGISLSTFVSYLRLGGYPRKVSPYRTIHENHIHEPYKSFAADVVAVEDEYFVS